MCNICNMHLLVCTQTNSKIFKNNEEQYVVSYWHHDQLGGCLKIQNLAALPKIVHLHCVPNSETHKFNKPSTLCSFEQCLPTIKSFFNGKQCPVPGVMRTVQQFSVDSLSCIVRMSTSTFTWFYMGREPLFAMFASSLRPFQSVHVFPFLQERVSDSVENPAQAQSK